MGRRQLRVSLCAEHPGAHVSLVEPQVEKGIVQFPGHGQGPKLCARLQRGLWTNRWHLRWPPHQELGHAQLPVDGDADVVVAEAAVFQRPVQGSQRNAPPVGGPVRLCCQLPGAGGDCLGEARPGSQIVDQPPLKGSAAPDAFGGGAQEVGVIAAHLAVCPPAGSDRRCRGGRPAGEAPAATPRWSRRR